MCLVFELYAVCAWVCVYLFWPYGRHQDIFEHFLVVIEFKIVFFVRAREQNNTNTPMPTRTCLALAS